MTYPRPMTPAPFTYEKPGFGSHVETFEFYPDGSPEWTTVILKDGRPVEATFVPGSSYSARLGTWASSFAVNREALRAS